MGSCGCGVRKPRSAVQTQNLRSKVDRIGVKLNFQNDVLARELPIHQGGVRHEAHQDGRVDGKC